MVCKTYLLLQFTVPTLSVAIVDFGHTT